MKHGKIYTWENREEARHLIGKKVAFAYSLKEITECPSIEVGELKSIEDTEYPFKTEDNSYEFIREIEEEEKPVRMTNKQLAEWCSGNNGQLRNRHSYIRTYHSYCQGEDDVSVREEIRIRSWGSDDWVEPTVYIYERDCKDWYRTASNKGE